MVGVLVVTCIVGVGSGVGGGVGGVGGGVDVAPHLHIFVVTLCRKSARCIRHAAQKKWR